MGTLLFMRDALVTLKLSSGGTAVEYQGQVSTAAVEVEAGDTVTYPVLDGTIPTQIGPQLRPPPGGRPGLGHHGRPGPFPVGQRGRGRGVRGPGPWPGRRPVRRPNRPPPGPSAWWRGPMAGRWGPMRSWTSPSRVAVKPTLATAADPVTASPTGPGGGRPGGPAHPQKAGRRDPGHDRHPPQGGRNGHRPGPGPRRGAGPGPWPGP